MPDYRPIFGDSASVARVKAGKRGKLSEHLLASSVASDALQRRAALEADERVIEGMKSAARPPVPGVAVGRRRRVRARTNTIAPSADRPALRVVYKGLDTYEANVLGGIREDFMLLLPYAQEQAKEAGESVLSPMPPFLGVPLTIKEYGGGTFAYLLSNADVALKVRKLGHAPSLADAQVRLSAACLHRLGYAAALAALAEWVGLWAPGAKLQPSRVDLCADTQGWQPGHGDFAGARDRWAFVCPVPRPTLIPYGEYLGYVRFGTGGQEGSRSGSSPVQLVVYDKSDEIRTHDKGWFVPLWARSAAYIDGEAVTRIEARFTREYLRERAIESQEALLEGLALLWREALDWCRYCVVSESDSNRARWELRPEWAALLALDWGSEAPGGLERIDQARPRLERTLAALGGHLVTLQALFGDSMWPDLDSILELVGPALRKRWDARGESFAGKVEARALRLGGLVLA